MLTIIFCRRNVDATKTHSDKGLGIDKDIDIELDKDKEKDNNIIVSRYYLIDKSIIRSRNGRMKHHASRQTFIHAGRYC